VIAWIPILCASLGVASAAVCYWAATCIGRVQPSQSEFNLQLAQATRDLADAVAAQQEATNCLFKLIESKGLRIDANGEAIGLLLALHCADVAGEPGSLKLVPLTAEGYPDAGKDAN
jgi:hypothetical protein